MSGHRNARKFAKVNFFYLFGIYKIIYVSDKYTKKESIDRVESGENVVIYIHLYI